MAAPATVIMMYWLLEPPPNPTAIIIIIPGVAIYHLYLTAGMELNANTIRDGRWVKHAASVSATIHISYLARSRITNSSFDMTCRQSY